MPRGRVEILVHDSRLLADNPLGDPAEREVGVYLPPGYERDQRRYPVIFLLAGFTGTGLQMVSRGGWTQPIDRRMDALLQRDEAAPAILVMPDCFTRYGGSQYVDSPALGRYASYITDELVPLVDARFRTVAERTGRGLIGKSSGGYGALHLGMSRPDLFAALASHAGDCAFELSYRRELPLAAAALDRDGGLSGFLARFDDAASKSSADIETLSIVCCAAAWSPSAAGPYGVGRGIDLPFEPRTGALREDVWARWLAADPLARIEGASAALRELALLFIDAGRSDEYALQLGARQLVDRLAAHGIPHVHEEFPGGHRNTTHRYSRSLELVSKALTRG
jgi:enterochelin esterase family protein